MRVNVDGMRVHRNGMSEIRFGRHLGQSLFPAALKNTDED
jgi:hypothetical protein